MKKFRKKVGKFIRNTILLIMFVIILIVSYFVYNGYTMYKDAINKVTLSQKVSEIRSQESYTKFENVSTDLLKATISVEDHRFYSHSGVDIISLARAMFVNISTGNIEQGGSTITQQLAKNMYFSQEQKFVRKIAEAFMAYDLEKNYSKNDILELYINSIYYGNGHYNIGDAAKGYYGKTPAELNYYESTMLAGIPNAPSLYAPTVNKELAEERRQQVVTALEKYGNDINL